MSKETITVKGLKKIPSIKGDMLAVSMNGNREATIAPWHKQEQDFVEKDVGIGGNFIGEILKKGGHTNIENIDFDSANKATGEDVKVEKAEETPKLPSVADERSNSIVAQCLTKCFTRNMPSMENMEDANLAREGIFETYKYFLGKLNE